MLVYRTFENLRNYLRTQVEMGSKVGFVPTMGALHDGHISLIVKANATCDITLASIFVNPTQFTSSDDLKKYPRTEEEDIRRLESAECDVVFIPSVDEVYPENYKTPNVELDLLENIMEGAHRPGHFNGVMQVVGRFFEQISPDYAFFGEKDFQQLAVVKKMVLERNFPIQIVGCDILREESGLAMSSRNVRLSNHAKEEAVLIYQQLNWAKESLGTLSVKEIKSRVEETFASHSLIGLEYFEIADSINLQSVSRSKGKSRAFIAVHLEGVRLIDNMALN